MENNKPENAPSPDTKIKDPGTKDQLESGVIPLKEKLSKENNLNGSGERTFREGLQNNSDTE